MKQTHTICVLGEGVWGTALAQLLTHNGHTVKVWRHDAPEDLGQALANVDWVFVAIPVLYVRKVLEQAKVYAQPNQTWVMTCKGIERDTLLLPTQILEQIFGNSVTVAVLSGPSFAQHVSAQQLTAVDVTAPQLAPILHNNYFITHYTADMIGAQVGGALKNVIALGVGILDGAGYHDNTQALCITKGLQEMIHVAHVLGGKALTLYGLSGLGDLILTCTGKKSRNRAAGFEIGRGTYAHNNTTQPEGFNTLVTLEQLIKKHTLNLPLCTGIYEIIINNKPVDFLIEQLRLA